jgi:hypothetical protein
MYATLASRVGARGNHAPLIGLSTHSKRLPTQLRGALFLNGTVERIQVDMDDRAQHKARGKCILP